MKSTSILALATAFAMLAPGLTLAQTSVSGSVNLGGNSGSDASVDVNLGGGSSGGSNANVDVNLGGSGSSGGSGASNGLNANADVSLGGSGDQTLVARVDINGDGTVTEDEILRANASLSALGLDATVDLNGDGTITAGEIAAADAQLSVTIGGTGGGNSGGTNVAVSIDLNGDGVLDAEELAAANAALEVALGASASVDLNGDGTITADEVAAANAALGYGGSGGSGFAVVSCADSGLDGMISALGKPDLSVLASAGSVQVVAVANCEAGEVSAALSGQGATDIRTVLAGNIVAVRAIEAHDADLSDVLGATTGQGSVTVYIAANGTTG